MYKLLRDALFLLPAETSHHLALDSLKLLGKTGLLGKPSALSGKPVRVMGIDFPNPVGLAAGLDKNGEYIDSLAALGFGFIEIGTVTPRPQPGNPKPRLFRLPEAKGIINRMGFNNHGIDYLLENVRNARYQGILGINIGKNFDTPVENAVDDYLIGLRKAYPLAHYITVNISSPNTPGLRKLQYGDDLKNLLHTLREEQAKLAQQYGRYVPVAIKVAPDLNEAEIRDMALVFSSVQIDALIATNTTLDKSSVEGLQHAQEQGGLSGGPLTQHSTEVIRQFRTDMDSNIPIIGVGGILSGVDAKAKLEAGASLVQVYSGFIYRGPELIRECVEATQ
ncbi:quinone-dependent dihydroorotate dehydrogenase [Thiothrix nivea]|uniref:Dihydroorotate dehydrogenase (quinone) n=1 Tax=Thiothrix nivea (strain ATCC 35100 / DSM 5205 / JP2) TaxID=870187 RepID=A0A656HCX9_THINJ|nr:quinone-dependent dihydroorotate dehydrogenase [Thiothrix nivea]EIJ33306.1 Dihydroorotate dehydrogenase [Thiothrix nivea DSM 5205]